MCLQGSVADFMPQFSKFSRIRNNTSIPERITFGFPPVCVDGKIHCVACMCVRACVCVFLGGGLNVCVCVSE